MRFIKYLFTENELVLCDGLKVKIIPSATNMISCIVTPILEQHHSIYLLHVQSLFTYKKMLVSPKCKYMGSVDVPNS